MRDPVTKLEIITELMNSYDEQARREQEVMSTDDLPFDINEDHSVGNESWIAEAQYEGYDIDNGAW